VDPKTNLEAKLTPSYPIGCKRVLISTDYFTVMGLSNVKLHTDPIMEVEADGIRTAESGSQKIDVHFSQTIKKLGTVLN
jgi:cation diffusion facilitator CzcD-associated flavoprotein CzcO